MAIKDVRDGKKDRRVTRRKRLCYQCGVKFTTCEITDERYEELLDYEGIVKRMMRMIELYDKEKL